MLDLHYAIKHCCCLKCEVNFPWQDFFARHFSDCWSISWHFQFTTAVKSPTFPGHPDKWSPC